MDCIIDELPAPWEIDHAARRADARALVRSTVPDQAVPPSEEIPGLIDHTLLRPDATDAEVDVLCAEARAYGFASVCVLPRFVPLAALALRRSWVRAGTVIGFPLGASATLVKAVEAAVAVEQGARELDMVLAIGALTGGALGDVALDIAAVVGVAHAGEALVKVILETALLSEEEQVRACLLARDAGADFVKTSTGYGLPGAEERDVRRLRALVPPSMGVKAAGGIRTRADLERIVRAGATRIGTSRSVEIIQEYLKAGAGTFAQRNPTTIGPPTEHGSVAGLMLREAEECYKANWESSRGLVRGTRDRARKLTNGPASGRGPPDFGPALNLRDMDIERAPITTYSPDLESGGHVTGEVELSIMPLMEAAE